MGLTFIEMDGFAFFGAVAPAERARAVAGDAADPAALARQDHRALDGDRADEKDAIPRAGP